MKRYVNIYEYIKLRTRSCGNIHDTREMAIKHNIPTQGQTSETVRILSADEEKEFAWEWFRKEWVPDGAENTELGIAYRQRFEQFWNGNILKKVENG